MGAPTVSDHFKILKEGRNDYKSDSIKKAEIYRSEGSTFRLMSCITSSTVSSIGLLNSSQNSSRISCTRSLL